MKIKTADLIGPALDWAVAKCEGFSSHASLSLVILGSYNPSINWAQGGSLIEREWIELGAHHDQWRAVFYGEESIHQDGHTPLIAAMRCFVASRLGDEVDVPEELL